MDINGRKIAQELNNKTAERLKRLPFKPLLCDVIVGDDPASLSYVGIKQRTAEKYGFKFRLEQLPAIASTQDVVAAIRNAQTHPDLCGLIVQLPLPKNLDSRQILSAINPEVDVDLINPQSAEQFFAGQAKLIPPTAGAILQILHSLGQNLTEKKFVVVGQGDLVGKPTAHLLKQQGYQVSVVTRGTPNIDQIISGGEVVISGAGQPGIITGDNLASGSIVIDAGTSESGGSIIGDVDYQSASAKARMITPVPGGVGPVTVAKLLENVALVAESKSLT